MKNLFRVLFLTTSLLSFISVRAQITITQGNVGSIMSPGNLFLKQFDTVATTLNIGNAGGPNTWNFSALAAHRFQRQPVVGLSAVPSVVRTAFPNGTHFLAIDTVEQGIAGTVYINLLLNSTGLQNTGIGGVSSGLLLLTSTPVPNEIVYGLPLALNTGWRTPYTNTVRFLGSVQSTTTHDAQYKVDAWGRITLPGGAVHDALRIRKYNFYNGTGYVLSYIFLARGGAQIEVEAASADTNQSGTIAIRRKTLIWNPTVVSDPLDVRPEKNVPMEFSLQQNYPNPFNPSTTINYQVAKEGLVTMKVFNLVGQQVATLVNDVKAPGEYAAEWNAEGMPSGVYFYKMEAGNFSATRRLVLLK